LTAGGDCPGLNAAIRAIVRASAREHGIRAIGFLDGFRGLVENRTVALGDEAVSGILTRGGTILGTSRDKPHSMLMGGRYLDMVDAAAENARRHHIDCLVCLGGGGTAKNAFKLHERTGLDVMTLPKTIDNDVWGTDTSFGFDTAVGIATEAIDRLHTTATSHHRMIVCEIMGHRAGWLTLQAGVAGGADVILIPEIAYDLAKVADFILERRRSGKRFSIIAIAEGATSAQDAQASDAGKAAKKEKKRKKDSDTEIALQGKEGDELMLYHVAQESKASRLARQLQKLTGVEARVTSLGHVQRGGVPSAFDRALCTLLGAKAADLLAERRFNTMVAYRAGECVPVPLEEVVGKCKLVPPDHPLIKAGRGMATCFGD
jgi:6-phosphofructokinase 1